MKALVRVCDDVAQFPPGHYFDSADGQLHRYYEMLSDYAEKEEDIHESHSIDAARKNQDNKYEAFKKRHAEWVLKQNQKKESK